VYRLCRDNEKKAWVKVCCISDIHGNFPDIAPCDLLIIAGDIIDGFRWHSEESIGWYDRYFRAWLKSVPAGEIVGVAGNHDFMYQRESEHMRLLNLPWIYLEDEPYKYMNYKIWGSPWQPQFGNWAFNDIDDDRGLGHKFSRIPDDTEILVTHGPPYGIGDKTFDKQRVGSRQLRRVVNKVRPTLHVFGHIHPARGIYHFNGGMQVNATVVDYTYKLVHAPVYLTLPDK
jgi:Icc-related predicted phosphoesterase